MSYRIMQGDVLERLRDLPDESIHCVVTSPPYYGLRDYGTGTWTGGDAACDHKQEPPRFNGPKQINAQVSGHASKAESNRRFECHCGATRIDQQIGLEKTPAEFLAKMVSVFREVRRVLRSDGTCWVNMGDSYAGSWGNQGRNDERGSQRPINGEMMQPVHDGRYPTNGRNTGKIPEGSGLKPKDLCGMPWRLAFALQDDGWWLRQDIIWAKPNPMPESVTDRCTKAHEYLFLLTKSSRYFYDAEAIKEDCVSGPSDIRKMEESLERIGGKHKTLIDPLSKASSATNIGRKRSVGNPTGRNKRSVWDIATEPYAEAHFATFPTKLVEPCILAGTSEKGVCENCWTPWVRKISIEHVNPGNRTTNGDRSLASRDITAGFAQRLEKRTDTVGWESGCARETSVTLPATVLDPFNGSGTTGVVALRYHRKYIGIELNPEYVAMAENRIKQDNPMFNISYSEPSIEADVA